MKKKEWIINELKQNSYEKGLVFNKYKEFVMATNSSLNESGFRSYVSRILKELIVKGNEDVIVDKVDFPIEEDEELLLAILEGAAKDKGSKLTLSDLKNLASENKISIRSFYNIEGTSVDETLKYIHKINHLHMDEEVNTIKFKRKIRVLQSEVNQLRNHYVDYSQIIDLLGEAVKIYTPWEEPSIIENKSPKNRAVVALFSDVHAGELVSFEETHGINKYDQEIMKSRIDSFFNQLIEYAEEVGSDELHLKMLGDMVNGEIHEELIRNSDLDTTESILAFADYISQWLTKLSSKFSIINVMALSGNHGRFSKKPNFKKKQTLNFDYLAYEFIRRETQNVVTSFEIPESPFVVRNINGFKFFSTHGDIFKGGTGLNPASGTIGRDAEKLSGVLRQINQDFQYMDIGHFHKVILDLPTFSGKSIMQNGSVKGTDEFSIGAVKAGERPSQVVYIVEEGYGVKFRTALYLD